MKESNITQVLICPCCGQPYSGHPALSRKDNKTPICSDCGTREALDALGLSVEERENIIAIIHKHVP